MEKIFNDLQELSQKMWNLKTTYNSKQLVVPERMIAKTLEYMSLLLDDLNELLEYYVNNEL